MSGVVMMFLLWFIPLVFILMALLDVLKNEFDPQINKVIWVLVIILMPLLGAILYYAIGRAQRTGRT